MIGAIMIALLVAAGLTVRWRHLVELGTPMRTVALIWGDTVSLHPGMPILNSGVRVGYLSKVERFRFGGLEATMALQHDFPIYADATLLVRIGPLGPNGELELDPGSPTSAVLAGGQAIPLVVAPQSPLAARVDSAFREVMPQ